MWYLHYKQKQYLPSSPWTMIEIDCDTYYCSRRTPQRSHDNIIKIINPSFIWFYLNISRTIAAKELSTSVKLHLNVADQSFFQFLIGEKLKKQKNQEQTHRLFWILCQLFTKWSESLLAIIVMVVTKVKRLCVYQIDKMTNHEEKLQQTVKT